MLSLDETDDKKLTSLLLFLQLIFFIIESDRKSAVKTLVKQVGGTLQ